jgi:hypothetical protein
MGKSRKSDAMDESTTEVTSVVTGDVTEDGKKAPPEVPAVDKEEYNRLCEKVPLPGTLLMMHVCR